MHGADYGLIQLSAMSFQFGFGEEDDDDSGYGKPTAAADTPDTHTRPVKEHDLQELVGKSFSPYLLFCVKKKPVSMAHLVRFLSSTGEKIICSAFWREQTEP